MLTENRSLRSSRGKRDGDFIATQCPKRSIRIYLTFPESYSDTGLSKHKSSLLEH